jgi:hypothetical protein
MRPSATISNFADFYRECKNPGESAAIIEQLYAYVLPHYRFRQIQTLPCFQIASLPAGVLDEIWNCVRDLKPLAQVERTRQVATVNLGGTVRTFPNPLHWAQTVMPTYRDIEMAVYAGVIHGDMHSGNLLIELPGPNLWIIDFAKTRKDAPTLYDFAKMEADLNFYLLPCAEDSLYFEQVLGFEEAWLNPGGVKEFNPPAAAFAKFDFEFQKAAASIGALRRMALEQRPPEGEDIVSHFATDSLLPYYLALFHATLRALTYEQCNPGQKVAAFVAAGLLCDRINQLAG